MSVILVMEDVNTLVQTVMVVSHVLVILDINLILTSIVQVDKHYTTHTHIYTPCTYMYTTHMHT